VVPLNWHAQPAEIAYMLADCTPKVLVGHADLLRHVRGVVPPGTAVIAVPTPADLAAAFRVPEGGVEPGDLAWEDWLAGFPEIETSASASRASIIYTSGTTGRPKGVRREPAGPERSAALRDLFGRVYGCREGMRGYVGGPLYHASPNAFARQGLAMAETLVLSTRFDAETLLRQIERHRLTTLVMVPTFFVKLLKLPPEVRARYDVSSLEMVTHTGAPCPPDVKRRMIEWWGPVLVETYGGTEMGVTTICTSADWLAHPGTVGRPAPNTIMRILDDNKAEVAPGQSGEIFARNPAYADFTYHGRDADRAAIEVDGLVTCGDVGYFDADGFLFLNDRKRDMIISGGVNIYPAEIENVLQGCAGVRDCAVFGIPDEEFGERVFAVVEREAGATLTEADVKRFVGAHLAAFKVPQQVRFDDALPREESGKIFKRRLRDPFWADRATAI
jgi:long-chain acyl-CoA synthetase